MKNGQNLSATLALAAIALLASSCDKGVFSTFSKNQGKGVGIAISTASSGEMAETKTGGTAVPNNVFSSADDDFVIEEYVSDIEDVMGVPETKGTEIKQTTASDNFNVANRQFQVMAFIDTTKTVSGVDVNVHVNEFNYPVKYDGSDWNWVVGTDEKEPCWRTSTKYSIWSYWPNDAELTADSRSAVSVPNWTSGTYNTLTFTHSVPKALEAQQDLLFAYNEETRDFAHIDGDEKKKYVYDGKEQTWIDNVDNDSQIFDGTNSNPKSRNIDIHFYHALAAVKFEVDPNAKKGVDVHSITLCYIDNSTKNIVRTGGLATTGTCSVSGPSLGAPTSGTPGPGTGTAGVSWFNLGGMKPLHYEIPSDKSVRSGYTETGDGVLFMIPQTATNLSVIIEFTAGDGNNYARVATISSVNWQAGKYYTYRLKPDFHLPGELLNGDSRDILFPGLKNSGSTGTSGAKAFTSNLDSKGVTCVGFMLASYACGITDGQSIFLMLAKNGNDPYSNTTGASLASGYGTTYTYDTWNDINFEHVESELSSIAQLDPADVSAAIDAIDEDKIFKFGLDSSGNPDNVPETYKSLDNRFVATTYDSQGLHVGSGKKSEGDLQPYLKKGPFYYAYRLPENADNDTSNDVNGINFIFKATAGSNDTGFLAYVLGIIVLEIAPDPDLPVDFYAIDWSEI